MSRIGWGGEDGRISLREKNRVVKKKNLKGTRLRGGKTAQGMEWWEKRGPARQKANMTREEKQKPFGGERRRDRKMANWRARRGPD